MRAVKIYKYTKIYTSMIEGLGGILELMVGIKAIKAKRRVASEERRAPRSGPWKKTPRTSMESNQIGMKMSAIEEPGYL